MLTDVNVIDVTSRGDVVDAGHLLFAYDVGRPA